jgi:hypothetical protein
LGIPPHHFSPFAPDLQTSGAQLLDDAARQGFDIPSRVLLDRCDDNAHDFEFFSQCRHPTFLAMTKPDLTDDDYSDLAALVREAIDAERYRIGPRIKKLRALLVKLDPASAERAVTPYPPPPPSAEPSLLYRKPKGSGRRR